MKSARADSSRLRLAALALFVCTTLLFLRATTGGFTEYDDPEYVTRNARVLSGLSWAGLQWALTSTAAANWHPLTWLSHQLDATVWGPNPFGHHLTSVLWHALNAVMALVVFRRLTGAFWPSAFAAASWAWHPLRVESVAWVAERKDLLSGFFGLLTIWLYLGYAERGRAGAASGAAGSPQRSTAGLWYAMTVAAFALGLMCKPMLVTLPCVLVLLDFWPLRRFDGTRDGSGRAPWHRPIVEKIPFLVLAAASSAITYTVQRNSGSVSALLGLDVRLANAAVSVWRYVWKMLWPENLAVIYPYQQRWPAGWVVTAALGLAVVSVLATRCRSRSPWLPVGWLWFLGTLVPVIGIVQVGQQSMADRYTYLPSLGLHLALAGALAAGGRLLTRGRRAVAAAGFLILASIAVPTWLQQGMWHDTRTLFEHALQVTQRNGVAENMIGGYELDAGRIDSALASLRRALDYAPDNAYAVNNFGMALNKKGDHEQAIMYFRQALLMSPDFTAARYNLGQALLESGNVDAALEQFGYVVARTPNDAIAQLGYGAALASKGRLAEAARYLEAGLRINPTIARGHGNLANLHLLAGRREEAVEHFRRAAELEPAQPLWPASLGVALAGLGRFSEAVQPLERALKLDPGNPDTHANLGAILVELGQREAAIEHLRASLALRPNDPQIKALLDRLNSPGGTVAR